MSPTVMLLDLVGVFGLGAVVAVGVGLLLAKHFLPAYLGEKGKNLATREDIFEITYEVGRVRAQYASLLEELKTRKEINMTIRLLAPLSIAIALSGCASNAGVYQNPIDNLQTMSLNQARGYASETRLFLEKNGQEKTIIAAQGSVKRTLKDPDSAKFQKLRIADYDGGKVVCGEINAKNSYGGYVGYRRFAAGISGATIFDTSSEYPAINFASNAGIFAACGYS